MLIKETLSHLLANPDNQISESACAGYPYLTLNHYDYNINYSSNVYKHLAETLKKYGYDNNWVNSNCCFFDVHPVFSDASPINGIMGLHLSLSLFDSGVAGKAQSLYFDTLTNWRKFSRISEKRVYPTASWIMFRYQEVADVIEDVEDDSDELEISDYYFKNSINLIKGNELNSFTKLAPTDFNSRLKNHYASIGLLDNRAILIHVINEYRSYIEYDIQTHPNLETSALYLFAVVFCREFGFDLDVFKSVISELGLKFDFLNDDDITHYSGRSVGFTQIIHLLIGNYNHSDINYSQADVHTLTTTQNTLDSSVVNFEIEGGVEISDIKELIKNQSSESVRRFYLMKEAVKDEAVCKNIIYKLWRELTLCFYHNKLNQDTYNKLRNIMDSHVLSEMSREKVLSIENYDIQLSAMRMCAFNIFINTEYDLDVISTDSSAYGRELFYQLSTPILTDDQLAAKNLLNTQAQTKLEADILINHRENLVSALNKFVNAIAHTDLSKFHGPRLSKLDFNTLNYLIVKWYINNYIGEYRKFTNKFEDIYSFILRDHELFSNNTFVQYSILKEVRDLLPVKYNPYLILDFNTNY